MRKYKMNEAVRVIGLNGKSGTGKSHRALEIKEKEKIEAIIDDGVLIYKNKIVAGKSAKKERLTVSSIRVATFSDPLNAKKIQDKIKKLNIKSILILGTSKKMIFLIAKRLGVPEPKKVIEITDITTKKERAAAKKNREEFGRHIIPLPKEEVSDSFSGFLIRSFKHTFNKSKNEKKTIIRPKYSYFGNFKISKNCIKDVIKIVSQDFNIDVKKIKSLKIDENLIISIEVSLHDSENITSKLKIYHKNLVKVLEKMTSIIVEKLDIYI